MTIQFDPEHEREEWLESRKLGIGGSDAPVILGMNPYQGPLNLYYQRLGMLPETDEEPAGEAAHWGKILEPVLIEEFERRTGYVVRLRNWQATHTVRTWQRGTVDGFVFENHLNPEPIGILEIKTTGVRREHDWDDGPPRTAWCQLQHYFSTTDMTRGWICVLIGGQQFRYFEVERDNVFINEQLVPAEEEFWRRLQEHDPPPVDGLASTNEIIDIRFPESIADLSVQLTGARDKLKALQRARWQAKEIETEIIELINWFKVQLGEAEYAKIDDAIVATWKSYTSRRLDTKALRAHDPELADRFTKETQARRFVILGLDDDE